MDRGAWWAIVPKIEKSQTKLKWLSTIYIYVHIIYTCMCIRVRLLSHVQLWHRMECSLPGSPVHGTFQPRILEWVAISSFSRSSQLRDLVHVSCIAGRVFTTEPPGKPIRPFLCFIALHRYYVFHKLKVCGNIVLSKSGCHFCNSTVF